MERINKHGQKCVEIRISGSTPGSETAIFVSEGTIRTLEEGALDLKEDIGEHIDNVVLWSHYVPHVHHVKQKFGLE